MIKILGIADVHLSETNNFDATIKCLDQVIRWSHEHQVSFCVVAGNFYERLRPSAKEILFTETFLSELSKQTPIIMISGDRTHEMGASPDIVSAIEPLRLVQHDLPIYVSSKAKIIEHEFNTSFYLLPTPYRSQLLTDENIKDLSSEEINAILTQKLKEIIWGFKAQFKKDRFNILVAHGSVLGMAYNEEMDVGLSDIFIDPNDLDGFDFGFFGHLHRGDKIKENAQYIGSLNRINFSEEHLNPHALLVELEKGQKPQITELYTSATKYKTFTIQELLTTENNDLDPHTHYRVKGEIKEEDLPILKAKLNALPVPIKPAFTVLTSDYMRSETLTHDLGLEASLLEYISLNPDLNDLKNDLIDKALELEKELTLSTTAS